LYNNIAPTEEPMPHSMLTKRIVILSIVFLLMNSRGLTQEVSLSVKQRPLSEVLQKISNTYNIKIAYDSDLVQKIVVSVVIVQKNPIEAVQQALETTNLEAIFLGDVIIVRPRVPNDASMALAQEPPSTPLVYKILGQVKAKGSKEQLPYASIAIVGTNWGTTSNTDGFFAINTTQNDSLKLIINYLGHVPVEVSFLPSAQKTVLNIEMERQPMEIDDVHIKVRQPDLVSSESSPGLLVWNSNRNSDIPSLNGLDISAPLQLLPGVDGTTETSAGLLVRKSQSDKNLITYDGFTIYHIDHFFGAFSSFNAKAIKDIRIYKGGFDSRWGGRSASVIEITGKTGNANQTKIDAGMDLLNFDATIEGPIGKKFTYVTSVRRSFTDVFRSTLYYNLMESTRSDFEGYKSSPSFFKVDIDEPTYRFADISLKLSTNPTLKDAASLTVYLGNDKLDLEKTIEYSTLSENSDWGNGGVGFRWSRQWSQSFNQILTLGASRYRFNFNHSDSTLRKRQNSSIRDTVLRNFITQNKLSDINLNITNSFKVSNKVDIQLGLQANGVDISYIDNASHYVNGFDVIDTVRANNQQMLHSSLWGQYAFGTGRLTLLKFGARINKYSTNGKFYFEPRLQVSIKPINNFSIKGAAGRYYQFVNRTLEFSQFNLKNVWYLSNGSEYPVVSSNHFTFGCIARFWGLILDAEMYYKQTDGLLVVQNIIKRTTGMRIQQEKRNIIYNNKAKGIDIMLRKEFPSTHIWMSYSLSKSTNQSSYFNWGVPYPAYDDQLHELKLAAVGKWRSWGYNLVWIFGSGKPWDEPVFTSNLNLSPSYSKNSNRLPNYHKLDAGLNYSIVSKRTTTKIGVNLLNVYNNKNNMAILYNLSETPYQTYIQTGTPLEYNSQYGLGLNWLLYLNVKF
jgi:ferric enterobactin receptor